MSGDADLYIWDPRGNSILVRNNSGGIIDAGTITATVGGVYQVEVFAFSDTTYRLSLTGGRSAAEMDALRPGPALVPHQEKTARPAPALLPSNEPENRAAVPVAPLSGASASGTPTPSPTASLRRGYLPIVIRGAAGW